MKRKVLACMLSCALTLTLLAGCGAKETEAPAAPAEEETEAPAEADGETEAPANVILGAFLCPLCSRVMIGCFYACSSPF